MTAPNDKRALSAEELLDFATCADPDRDRMRDRLLAEHAALKAELAEAIAHEHEQTMAAYSQRDTALRALTEAREQLDAERKRSAFLEEELDQREESRDRFAAELAACRRERDEALRLEPLRTRLWCDGCERSRATCFYALDGDVALNCDECCGHAACTRLAAAQSAPSEREAPAPVDPEIVRNLAEVDAVLAGIKYRATAPQPAEATRVDAEVTGCAGICGLEADKPPSAPPTADPGERVLKPCPFCGELPNTWTEQGETLMAGHATVWHACVECPNNCAEMRDEDPDGAEAMSLAIEAWDRRADDAYRAKVAALCEMLDNASNGHCGWDHVMKRRAELSAEHPAEEESEHG
jgi:hypothetical protein